MIITNTEVQKKNSSRISVFIDDKYAFGMEQEDWFKLHLYIGQEITEEEIEKIDSICNYSRAKKIAIKYILYRRRTSFEVYNRLEREGYEDDLIEKVINDMKKMGYIDDEDYTCRFIKDSVNIKNQGRYRISLELQKKGIDKEVIEESLERLNFNEEIMLENLIRKKFKLYSTRDEQVLNKMKSHFIRKGYSFGMINRIINDIIREYDD